MAKVKVSNKKMAELFSLLLSEYGDMITRQDTRDRIGMEFIEACEYHGVTFDIDASKLPNPEDLKENEKKSTKKKTSVEEMVREEELTKQSAKDKPDNFTNLHSKVMKEKNANFKKSLKNVK